MYTDVLYVVVGLLVSLSLLLWFAVQVLITRAKAATREKMRSDIDRVDNLLPPQLAPAAEEIIAPEDVEKVIAKPVLSDDAFTPSTIRH
jgi:hypothetical protein